MVRFLKKNNRFLLIPILLYLPFVFLGYGPDSDSYETLRTGVTFIANFDYVPSRNPGYFVFEVVTFFANLIGGSVATNLMAVFMSLICLYGFYQLCKTLSIPNSEYLVLSVALHPYYWVASTITMDYVFALGFFFLGVSLLLNKKRAVYAGIAFSLAIGSRLTTAPLVFFSLVFLLAAKLITLKETVISLFMTSILAPIFYFPPLDFVGWRWWNIMKPVMGDSKYWSLFLRMGRFLYKNITFWGVPVLLFLVVMIICFLIKGMKIENGFHKVALFSLMIILVYEVIFYFAPLDPSYLLVILPFFILIAGIPLRYQRKALAVLLLLVFISNFIVLNIARPNIENFATGASYGLWLEPGHLIETTRERMKVLDCIDLNCYQNKIRN